MVFNLTFITNGRYAAWQLMNYLLLAYNLIVGYFVIYELAEQMPTLLIEFYPLP